MFDRLKRIKESIGYYVKQNKRLSADDRFRKFLGEEEINKRHIVENEKRIEKLRTYYDQVLSEIKHQTKIKRVS